MDPTSAISSTYLLGSPALLLKDQAMAISAFETHNQVIGAVAALF